MDSQEHVSNPSTLITSPGASEDLENLKAGRPSETADESESDDSWTEVWKSFKPLLGCLGWIVLPIAGVVGVIQLYRQFGKAIADDLKSVSYEHFGIVVLLLFMTLLFSLFPLFLQRSFELTKKARIQSDVWIDLLTLGYWTKLRLSADANDQLARDREKNIVITGKNAFSKLAANVQALSAGPTELSSSPYIEALQQFTKRFEENYGRQAFSAPLAMLTVLYLVGWLSVLFPYGPIGEKEYGSLGVIALLSGGVGEYIKTVVDNLNIVTAAFLGAYLFSVQGLFRRYQRSDFKPIAVTQACVRVLTAWIVALLLVILDEQGILKLEDNWLLLGFFTGLFSLQVLSWIWDITVKRIPNFRASRSGLANVELIDLDGLDSWHQDRLDEAGINYVRGLATADFLDLLIAVRLPCETMVDWVDQAILRMHVNKDTWKQLQEQTPIRTATDLLDAIAGPKDHRASLIRIMDGKSAQGANASSFADKLLLMEDALRQDPNIAHIRVFRDQMHRVVDHATAYPPNWPRFLTKRFTLSKETTKISAVIDAQVPATEPGQPVEGSS